MRSIFALINNSARRAILALAAMAFLTACESTGGPLGLTKQQQLALGAQEHPKILSAFGGEIKDPELKAYVNGIVKRLMAASDQPDMPIKTTVLDSPVVNAMALPGHIYATRGLLALANTEAELAGVLGHEIGHIFEQHTAERVSRSNVAGLGAAVIGILTGDAGIYQMAAQGAQLYLLSFSRSQEYEADQVGVRLLARAGYEPAAEADFLNSLNRWSELEARVSGRQARPPEFLSTHPNTAERVRRAAAEAQVLNIPNARKGRNAYLGAIDNMLYGDDPRRHGFIRGNTFYHPDIGMTFRVPEGMKLRNTPQAVVAQSQNAQMQFIGANSREGPGALINALSQQLQLNLGQPRRISVNGKPGAYGGARANARSGPVVVQAYAIQWQGTQHFIFMWVTPANSTRGLQRGIDASINSFRPMRASAMQVPKKLKVDVRIVRSGDTVSSLAGQTRFENAKTDRFIVINGLRDANDLRSGQKVKLIK